MMNYSRLRSQKGNILFIILMCVVLFAALAYAVNSSMRGGGKNASAEKEQLDTAVSQQCISLVENSVQRIKVMNGCTDDQISYELPNGANPNPDAPPSKKCHVFAPQGAGATPCGGWLQTAVVTGTISLGDTTTIAALGVNSYIKCDSFMNGGYYCDMRVSTDGSNWMPACWEDQSANGLARDTWTFSINFVDSACVAMCGGGGTNYSDPAYGSGSALFIEDDFSLTPMVGTCQRRPSPFACACF